MIEGDDRVLTSLNFYFFWRVTQTYFVRVVSCNSRRYEKASLELRDNGVVFVYKEFSDVDDGDGGRTFSRQRCLRSSLVIIYSLISFAFI